MAKHHAQNNEDYPQVAPHRHPHETSEPAREARALAWRFVFECYFARKNATSHEDPDTKQLDEDGSAQEHGRA